MCKKGCGKIPDAPGGPLGTPDALARKRESSSLRRRSALEAAPRGATPAVGSGGNVEASGDGGTVFVGTAVLELEDGAGSLSPIKGGGKTPD